MVKSIFALCLTLLLGACSAAPVVKRHESFNPSPEQEKIFIAPFTAVMVPEDIEAQVFDTFVDRLNEASVERDYEFAILKTDLKRVDEGWLGDQYYMRGEIFAYFQDSGCCSTVLQLKGRLRYFQPGQEEPVLSAEFPAEIFFEHDYADLTEQRRKLAQTVALELAEQVLFALDSP